MPQGSQGHWTDSAVPSGRQAMITLILAKLPEHQRSAKVINAAQEPGQRTAGWPSSDYHLACVQTPAAA